MKLADIELRESEQEERNDAPTCRNCSAELHGRYCHACGQKSAATEVRLHDFVHEATHEFLHLDGKILTTFKLLVAKPGMLTKEFLEGRRARYISPLRVYLTFSVLFFALVAIVPGARDAMIRASADDTASSISTAEEQKIAEEIRQSLQHNLPRVMFVLMPVFGLITWAFYRRAQPYYIPHLYYSVHFHAFAFVTLIVAMLIGLAGPAGKAIGSIAFLALIPYHYFGLRRMFGEAWPKTIAKGTAIAIVYWLAIAGAMFGLVFWTIRNAA